MKNKIFKIIILALIITMYLQIQLFANTLTLNISANKQKVRAGNEFIVIVSWEEGMQAADFYLKYDSEKLKFIKANISNDYMNIEKSGQIKTAWVSLDNTDKTEIKYTFKAEKSGIAEFETQVNGGFATGDLKIIKECNEGKLTLDIEEQLFVIKVFRKIIIITVFLVLIRIIVVFRKKDNKKGKVNNKVKIK